jgi:hypothetical protein
MAVDHIKKVSSYDRLFDQAQTHQYNLSIRLNPDGLSFAVYSIAHKRYIAIESISFPDKFASSAGALAAAIYLDNIAKAIDEKSWLISDFRNKVIIYNTRIYTLIPEPLYNSDEKDSYLSFVHKTGQDDIVIASKLEAADSRIIFGINKNIFNELNSWFNSVKLMHHAGALLESVLPVFKHSEPENPVIININKKHLDIIALRDNKLSFINTFEWHSGTDIVYFTLFVLDQLSLNPGKVHVFLCGDIDEDDENHQLIVRYIRNVGFLSRSESYTKGYALELIHTHKYFDLLNPALCE